MESSRTMAQNRTKNVLRSGGVAFGTLSLLPEPGLPEIVGAAGYDFFVHDTEHVANDGQHLVHGIRASQAAGVTPIVRVRYVEEKTLLWVLDSGVGGVMVPMVNDAQTARRAYELTRYPPMGERTLCSATRAAGHGAYRRDFVPFLETANDEMLVIALLETPEAAANVEQIVREPIEVFIVGRGDISLKMGHRYAPRHPEVTEVTKRMLDAAMKADKVAGVLAYDVEDAREWIDFGCRFMIYSQPEMILSNHYIDVLSDLKAAAEARPATVTAAV